MGASVFLKALKIDESWMDFLSDSILAELSVIEDDLADDLKKNLITPDPNKVLRFLELPLHAFKILILGQDPYPQKGAATGRAFEVGNLSSWEEPFRNVSLQNIIRAIVKSTHNEVFKFSEIRKQLGKTILLAPPAKLFVDWEQQGVLLLNTAFTCKIDQPNSHTKIWNNFTEALLIYIKDRMPELIWFVWGNNAQCALEGVHPKNAIFTYHPSRCNPRPNDFLYGETNCFALTAYLVTWLGCADAPQQMTLFPVVE